MLCVDCFEKRQELISNVLENGQNSKSFFLCTTCIEEPPHNEHAMKNLKRAIANSLEFWEKFSQKHQ